MLLRMLRNIVSRRTKTQSVSHDPGSPLNKASLFAQQGDIRSAIIELRRHLERFPHDVAAINNLGCHLADIGDESGASKCFELAYSLDDSFLPGIVNHAKFLNDRKRSEESLRFLREAKSFDPDFCHIDAVYGGVALARGDSATARRHALRAWHASFDNLRFANCYLLYCAYDDLDETTLAAEHKFWGETISSLTLDASDRSIDLPGHEPPAAKRQGVVRIGYWSPDFKNHSVRFFFRPLLDNHDRTRFETFLYHDHPLSDAQTEEIRRSADRFFDVSACSDRKLVSIIKSHQLDILVELAGHTSANRLSLLQERLATIQITGLGYPPTTGLSGIDAKLIDVHIEDEYSKKYYTEEPLVLPSSFWCFDPYEEAPIALEFPAVRNGYVTFACVGNIAKISQPIIQCWAKILAQVPNSKLMIRSISFNDEAALQTCRQRILHAGISADRLILLKPEGGAAFFASYNDIDIVLDTFPFNGGTTTCFATYMGVPVVSLAGKSLNSRMGKSILTNLGLSDWIVETEDDYVARAVAASQDTQFLTKFRAEARSRFRKSALGNGKLFARDFEEACHRLLKQKQTGQLSRRSSVSDLAPQEIIKRAYFTLQTGQEAAAQRIVDYCLRAYPTFGAAHILWTRRLTGEDRFRKAADYLLDKWDSFDPNTRFAALINIARNYLLLPDYSHARQTIHQANAHGTSDATDICQIRLLESVLTAIENGDDASPVASINRSIKISVFVASDQNSYPTIVEAIRTACKIPQSFSVEFVHCPEDKKGKSLNFAVRESDADIAIWMNKNISIANDSFFFEIDAALRLHDVVGFSGASAYERLEWRRCEARNKAGSYLVPSGEREGYFDLQIIGAQTKTIVDNMVILDGGLLAFSPYRLKKCADFEFDLFLESAATLMEEYFTYQCHKAGLRLAVHQSLGVIFDWRTSLLSGHHGEAKWHLAQKLEFDPFENLQEDRMIISAPVESAKIGVKAQRIYFELAQSGS